MSNFRLIKPASDPAPVLVPTDTVIKMMEIYAQRISKIPGVNLNENIAIQCDVTDLQQLLNLNPDKIAIFFAVETAPDKPTKATAVLMGIDSTTNSYIKANGSYVALERWAPIDHLPPVSTAAGDITTLEAIFP
jgi:hypothetical protein